MSVLFWCWNYKQFMIPLMKCVVLTAVIHILVFWLNHKTVHMGEKKQIKRQTSGRNRFSRHYRNRQRQSRGAGKKHWDEWGMRGRGSSREQNKKHMREQSRILMQAFVILGKADSGASPLQNLLTDSTASI